MLLKKISTKTVFGDKGEILEMVMKDKTKSHPMLRVVGIATDIQKGKSKFDDRDDDDVQEWTAFIGRFEATNAITGQVFNSPKCFLPAFAAEIVAGQFDGDGDVQKVEFAFDIGAHYSEDSIVSYEFDINPLTEYRSDDLEALSSLIAKKTAPQLSGPKDD